MMKVYDKDKLNIMEYYDLSKGYLKEDVLITVVPKVQAVKEQFHYEVVETFENGGQTVKKVIDIPGVVGKPAKTIEEPIHVYIPYTTQELEDIKIQNLRLIRRGKLLPAFDKWEKAVIRGREEDNLAIMAWYRSVLNLEEEAFLDVNIPEKIKYYY